MPRSVSFIVAILLPWWCTPAIPADPQPDNVAIAKLIERLVSPNLRPKGYPEVQGDPEVEYPAGYDRNAQRVVMQVFYTLQDIGPQAFPVLAKYVDDPRYSFTEDAGEVESNWSVGKACYDIIDSQVHAYTGMWHTTLGEDDPRSRPRRPSGIVLESDRPNAFQAWCEARKSKPLRELQIEALENTIAREAKRPQDFTDEERNYLKQTLAKLRASKEPLPPASRWAR